LFQFLQFVFDAPNYGIWRVKQKSLLCHILQKIFSWIENNFNETCVKKIAVKFSP